MKNYLHMTLSTVALCTVLSLHAQKIQFGIGYNMMLPQNTMKNGWNAAHGLTMDLMLRIKSLPMLKAGVEMNYGLYASTTQSQQYVFRDGTTTVTDVQFSSSIASIGGKALLESPKAKTVKPYGAMQFGALSMFSDLYIEDPRDPLGCRALEARTLVNDITWYTALGGGLKVDMSARKRPGRNFLDIGLNYVAGGQLEYANMNRLSHHTPTNPAKDDFMPLNVRFINVNTNEIHEHQVAELYNHTFRSLQLLVKWTIAMP